MAEAAFRQMISSLIRQTRPTFQCGKAARRLQRRTIATAAAHQEIEEDLPPRWAPHSIPEQTRPNRPRLDRLRNEAEPRQFSSFLTDNYAREHNYLRISVTERCNLRCTYCMPGEGVQLSPPSHLLTTPEIVHLSSVFVNQGVNKIRLTGGEPTVRKDIVPLMQQIGHLRKNGLKELCITTNGISLHRKLDAMVEAGLTACNLSLDTLDPYQFTIMTRRNGHEAVMRSVNRILEMNRLGAGIKLKINCVVMRSINERDIIPFVEMGQEQDLEVRFIEYMPFGGNKWSENKMISYQEMLAIIREKYPLVGKVTGHPNDTSKTYKIPDFVGRIGFITSMTDNFCGSCNRLRITSDGNLKVCLFGNAEVSLRDIMRESNNGQPIDQEAMEAIKKLEMDRRQALPGSTGALGVSPSEARLLEVIGMAVKRKKEKHAGMGELEHMENRPMILIDPALPHAPSTVPLNQALRRPSILPSAYRPLHSAIPLHLLPSRPSNLSRLAPFSTARALSKRPESSPSPTPPSTSDPTTTTTPKPLTHLTPCGHAHMVPIHHKSPTHRSATATTTLSFSTPQTLPSLLSATAKKGDAFAVARVAGIQAAKLTSTLIPLAHPGLGITFVGVEIEVLEPAATPRNINSRVVAQGQIEDESRVKSLQGTGGRFGAVRIEATVECEGKTGVEMEALTAAQVAGLVLYDMLKGVDRGMCLGEGRVVRKMGGRSGGWKWDGGRGEVVRDHERGDMSGVEEGGGGGDGR